ncbi:hypothetical protein Tco_1478144, partial [Tanacetum coccineum]
SGVGGLRGSVNQSGFSVLAVLGSSGSLVEADLPVLEPLDGALPLGVSLVVDGFLEDSDSLVLLLFVFLPWFGPARGLHHHRLHHHYAFSYGI